MPGNSTAAALIPAKTSGVLDKVHEGVPVVEVCKNSDDEEGAEHGQGADHKERLVALVLPHNVGQNAERNGQADGKCRHLSGKCCVKTCLSLMLKLS